MIERLRELEQAATPGLWQFIEPHHLCRADGYPLASMVTLYRSRHADAALIAAMRNALPALLDVAEAARYEHGCGGTCPLSRALAALEAL